jgi:hypothetical protein
VLDDLLRIGDDVSAVDEAAAEVERDVAPEEDLNSEGNEPKTKGVLDKTKFTAFNACTSRNVSNPVQPPADKNSDGKLTSEEDQ